jgi:hypothetical protein
VLAMAALWLSGCRPAPPPAAKQVPDPTTEQWYSEAAGQLAAMDRDAERLLKDGKPDDAAALITKGQPIANRLLSAPRPTLEAMQAASDLDDLYARMLLANKRYGWARLFFQKNLTRWKTWRPQTEETARRMKLAAAGIAECDRRLGE